jgi:DNA-binding CsgD family transcriptional regulator
MRRGRPPYPDVLTPREWEVLSLIREGLTNDEIARRLGLTERGARFHVSEILSKLGVESRQEAAKWREPRKPFALGGLLMKSGASAAITAAVLALIVLAVGILAMDWRASFVGNSARGETSDEERPGPPLPLAGSSNVLPFYMEVALTSELPGRPTSRTTIARWYQGTDSWREEYLNFQDPNAPGTTRETRGVTIVNGHTTWYIQPESKTYFRSDRGGAAQWEVQHLQKPNYFGIGPTNCNSLDELVRFVGGLSGQSARVVGEEDFRGVRTQIIEYGRTLPPTLPTLTGKMWVDPSGRKAVILRHQHQVVGQGNDQSYDVEVTSISYSQPIDASLLEFKPEPGMTEVPGPGGAAPASEPQAIRNTCLPF